MELKFKIKIGKFEEELTEEQAKELHAKLDSLFGSKNNTIWVDRPVYIPYEKPWKYPWYEVTCDYATVGHSDSTVQVYYSGM